jgi:hypothetical protein
MFLWTNHLCISHNHILVNISCHSITKTKQGPFTGGRLRFGSIDVPIIEMNEPISGAVFPRREASPIGTDAGSQSAQPEPLGHEAVAATTLLDSLDGRLQSILGPSPTQEHFRNVGFSLANISMPLAGEEPLTWADSVTNYNAIFQHGQPDLSPAKAVAPSPASPEFVTNAAPKRAPAELAVLITSDPTPITLPTASGQASSARGNGGKTARRRRRHRSTPRRFTTGLRGYVARYPAEPLDLRRHESLAPSPPHPAHGAARKGAETRNYDWPHYSPRRRPRGDIRPATVRDPRPPSVRKGVQKPPKPPLPVKFWKGTAPTTRHAEKPLGRLTMGSFAPDDYGGFAQRTPRRD